MKESVEAQVRNKIAPAIIALKCHKKISFPRTQSSLKIHSKLKITPRVFLSARNDALANVAIILVGFVTAYTRSGWPDFIIGIGIMVMNADAAREVWRTAIKEHREANA